MKSYILRSICILALAAVPLTVSAQRTETYLKKGWKFTRSEATEQTRWQEVDIPHDWAIYGPFAMENDLQITAVEQNGEVAKTLKTAARAACRSSERANTAQRSNCPIQSANT